MKKYCVYVCTGIPNLLATHLYGTYGDHSINHYSTKYAKIPIDVIQGHTRIYDIQEK